MPKNYIGFDEIHSCADSKHEIFAFYLRPTWNYRNRNKPSYSAGNTIAHLDFQLVQNTYVLCFLPQGTSQVQYNLQEFMLNYSSFLVILSFSIYPLAISTRAAVWSQGWAYWKLSHQAEDNLKADLGTPLYFVIKSVLLAWLLIFG